MEHLKFLIYNTVVLPTWYVDRESSSVKCHKICFILDTSQWGYLTFDTFLTFDSGTVSVNKLTKTDRF